MNDKQKACLIAMETELDEMKKWVDYHYQNLFKLSNAIRTFEKEYATKNKGSDK